MIKATTFSTPVTKLELEADDYYVFKQILSDARRQLEADLRSNNQQDWQRENRQKRIRKISEIEAALSGSYDTYYEERRSVRTASVDVLKQELVKRVPDITFGRLAKAHGVTVHVPERETEDTLTHEGVPA